MTDEPGGDGEEDLEALSFEELVDRLEALTDQLADGGIGIERAADLYERAQRLHAAAAARLEAVAKRIETL
jgi:exodeoxyribonuclease VII small subunit